MAEGVRQNVIRAAGGIVWRVAPDHRDEPQVEVVLIHRPRYNDWSLPKGKLAPGEPEVEGAVREVFEETGYRVRVGRPLGEVRYMKASGSQTRPKVVRYWSMQADGGAFFPNREVDQLRWVSLAEAQELLTHDHDRDILRKFVQGPAITGCVLLVRHASAGSRSKWEGDDRLRPLDDLGWAQADELIRLLSRFDVESIISADYVRCAQTVEPLGEAIGVAIQQERLFSEDGYPGREEDALTMIRKYATALKTTAVCSQGDVIPDLLERITSEDDFDLPEPVQSKKGSVWALFFDGERLFTAEHFPPPRVG